tara:strand:- start:8086 stop:8259 length:174 start_codon:yes stop_codon:yes gene_type:complete
MICAIILVLVLGWINEAPSKPRGVFSFMGKLLIQLLITVTLLVFLWNYVEWCIAELL